MLQRVTLALACFALVSIPCIEAQARIVRVEITKTEPAFGGRGFGEIGTFERVTGKAHGEVDPQSPANAIIQDIALAPRNARGMVEYSIDIDIVRPSDRSDCERQSHRLGLFAKRPLRAFADSPRLQS